MPVFENGRWTYAANTGRTLNRQRFEEWKTKFYEFEGWNPTNGWPRPAVLESLGLKKAADVLRAKGRLG